jgi:hypothetical protein
VRNPANNILVCDYPPGQYQTKPAIKKHTSQLTNGDKFCKVMAIMKEIAGTISLKKPSVFDKWIRAFEHIRDKCGETLIPLLYDDGSETASQEEDDSSDRTPEDGDDHGRDERAVSAPPVEDPEMKDASLQDSDGASFTIPAAVRMRFARKRENVLARQKLMEKIKREAGALAHRESIPRTDYSLVDAQDGIENQSYCFSSAMHLVRVAGFHSVSNASHRNAAFP